jgi:hypothetical protein
VLFASAGATLEKRTRIVRRIIKTRCMVGLLNDWDFLSSPKQETGNDGQDGTSENIDHGDEVWWGQGENEEVN